MDSLSNSGTGWPGGVLTLFLLPLEASLWYRMMSVRANDVAAYILRGRAPLPAMKLHKLVYYSLVWSLVWDDEPLIEETIEAWANGPVIRDLYDAHRGEFSVSSIPGGDPDLLDSDQRETVDAILQFYGEQSSQWLNDLTQMESPWREARENNGLGSGERGQAPITQASMHEYYSAL